jgi:hypothetical protein
MARGIHPRNIIRVQNFGAPRSQETCIPLPRTGIGTAARRVQAVYSRSAFLAILANQAIRRINNLRVINTAEWFESNRRHQNKAGPARRHG